MTYAAAFFAAMLSVFFRVLQQRNAQGDHYWLVIPTSLGIAVCELLVLGIFIRGGASLIYAIFTGTGAGIGCMLAMYVHRRFVKPRA